MRKLAAVTTGIFIILFLWSATYAEEATKSSDWEFDLAPFYLWAVSMDGDMTVQGSTAPLEVGFGDIVSNMEELFIVHFEGMHKSGWGILTDISYLTIGGQQTTTGPTLDVDFTTVMTELGGLYRINHGANALDLIGGIRYYDLDLEIDVIGVPPRIDKGQDWVDAMLGARYTWTFTDKWNLMARGDLGLGGSDLTYNLVGLFKYKPWKHVSFIFGYRYMDIDYEDGSGANLFKYDVTMHGPLLGVNFVW